MTFAQAERNMARNNVLDRIVQGAAAFGLVALAFHDLLENYIHANYPVDYILAGGVVAFLIYSVLAPMVRN